MPSDMSVEINKAIERVMEKNENIKMKKYATNMDLKEFELFRNFIHSKFGMDITENKKHMLEIKVNRLMAQNKMENCMQYYNMISTTKDKQKIVEFLNEITINKTDFFREINHFNFLKNHLEKSGFKLTDSYVELESLYYQYTSSRYSVTISKGEKNYTFSIRYNWDKVLNNEIIPKY